MRVASQYLVRKYGAEPAEAIKALRQFYHDCIPFYLKHAIVAKRIRAWILPKSMPPILDISLVMNEQAIYSFVDAIVTRFCEKYPGRGLKDFRIERRDKTRPFDLENLVFVEIQRKKK